MRHLQCKITQYCLQIRSNLTSAFERKSFEDFEAPQKNPLPILAYEIYAIKVSQNLTVKTSKSCCFRILTYSHDILTCSIHIANRCYDSQPPSVTKLPRSVTHHDPVYGFGNVIIYILYHKLFNNFG